jgi:asparagine synthase (glutamine-hydrolysing)
MHQNYLDETRRDLLPRLDKILIGIFERLIRRAQGRTIAVPLSGGYDSRLIVLMLKRLGYRNLLAFSYGLLKDEESCISRAMARSLDIQWQFIP